MTTGSWPQEGATGQARAFGAQLDDPAGFAIVLEVTPWRGDIKDPAGRAALAMVRDLAGESRIAAFSVPDNAGGHPRLGPLAIVDELGLPGERALVHVACRDRSRAGLESLAWELRSRALPNVLVISGDYPTEGLGGLSRPVFDLDSAALLDMYAGLGGLRLGAAVNCFKRFEREAIPQYLKLALKVRSGATFVIGQAGYDARAQDELVRYMRLNGLAVPALGGIYVLSRGVARAFHEGRVPGCVVTDELLELAERRAAAPDRGRGFFVELAAKQLAVARGIGYRGAYLAGQRDAGEVRRILDLVDGFGPDEWRSFVAETSFAQRGTFRYFERDDATGLNTDEVNREYRRNRTARTRRGPRRWLVTDRSVRRGSLRYRFDRAVHDLVFDPNAPGFALAARCYRAVERAHLGRPLHVLEEAVKAPLYDCRDCGDCSLPETAYLCPESRCAKNQRNGPCGGSSDGRCEVGDGPCLWAVAYDRLASRGEELAMLDRPVAVTDNALRRTSAWANTFLGRDHLARRPANEG